MNGECRTQKMSSRHFQHFKNPDLDAFIRSQKSMCPGLKGHMVTLGHAFLKTVHSKEKYFKTYNEHFKIMYFSTFGSYKF